MDINALEQQLQSAHGSEDLITLATLSSDTIEKFPNSPVGYYFHGEYASHEVVNDLERAEWAYGTASALAPENLDFLKKYVHIQEKLMKFQEAAGTYAYILSKFPEDREAKLALGIYELRQNQEPENALGYFAELIQANVEDVEAYTYAAEAYTDMEDFEQASAMVEYALAKQFTVHAALTKIELLKQQEYHDEIPLVFAQIVEANPDVFAFRYDYAKSLFLNKAYEEAKAQFEAAVALLPADQPFDTLVYTPIAENLLKGGHYAEAAELFTKCIQHDEHEDLMLYELRAAARADAGDIAGSVEDYQYLLEKKAGDDYATVDYSIRLGYLLIKTNEIDAAEEFFEDLGFDEAFADRIFFAKALIAKAKGDMDTAYQFALAAMSGGDMEIGIFFEENFEAYIDDKQAEVLAEHAAAAAENANSGLSQLFGKLWVFNYVKTPTIDPASLTTDEEKDIFKEMLEPYCLVMSDKLAYFIPMNFGVELDQAARSYVYAYKIEKSKDTLFLLKFTALDKLNTLDVKIKIDGPEAISLTKAENEMYKLGVHKDLEMIPFALQGRFAEVFELINPIGSHPLEGETKKVVAALLNELI